MIPLVIHPGFPRTATTTIQKAFTASIGPGLYLGKHVGLSSGASWQDRAMNDVDLTLRGLTETPLDAKGIRSVLENIVAERGSGARFLLYSNEKLSRPWSENPTEWCIKQINLLKTAWPDVRAIFTIRNQADLIYSLYRKRLKHFVARGERPVSFKTWLEGGGPYNYADYFSFDRMITVYREALGSNAVAVVQYEAFREDTSILSDAAARLAPEFAVTVDGKENMNASEPLENLRWKFARNSLIRLLGVDCVARLGGIGGVVAGILKRFQMPASALEMSIEERSRLLMQFQESNDRLVRSGLLRLRAGYFDD